MKYVKLDTPSLLVDIDILKSNLQFMQNFADKNNVALRPHTKTHKSPLIASMQIEEGAKGVTVAKIGEAEIMASYDIADIFIANEIAGYDKLERIKKLSERANVSFGIDNLVHIEDIEKVFVNHDKKAEILIEIEVGENRSGVVEKDYFITLLQKIKESKYIHFKGIFSHDGHTYRADSIEDCIEKTKAAQKRTLEFAEIAADLGLKPETVSIGSTPPMMRQVDIMKGITEIRPGTYPLMDAGQSKAYGSYDRCAATVLARVISKPTDERVILDVGAKGLTMQSRETGLCATRGKGFLKDYPDVIIESVYDEHAVINNREFSKIINIKDKVRIVPNHICPVCNLYDKAYFISGDDVVGDYYILARGKMY